MPNLTGQSIGRYHILEQLGEGGMAIVYKAYDTRLERNVAFKVLRTEQFSPVLLEQVLQRFDREAKSLARLSHPNIINILDYGEHNDSPYLVMEYLPGGTLKEKLGHMIPWQEAINTLLPIARGLAFAHQHNIIHRDVKPANILMNEINAPILTDFGIAKLLEGVNGHTLTASGVGIGTPEYMAPEQGMGASTIDARADIYSLGIVLYEMVTGRKPYIADTPMAVVLKQMTDPLPRPCDIVPDLPEDVENILFKALAKKPEDRFEDMNAFIAAMEGVLAEKQKVEVSAPAKRVKKRAEPRAKFSPKVAMAVAGALTVILVIAFGRSWIIKRFSTESEAGATPTKVSDKPSSTFTLFSSTKTLEPSPSSTLTRTPRPTRTNTALPSWVTNFAEPILAAIKDRKPDFQDDFSTDTKRWYLNSLGVTGRDWIKAVLIDKGVMRLQGEFSVSNYYFLYKPNIVLQVDILPPITSTVAVSLTSPPFEGDPDKIQLDPNNEWSVRHIPDSIAIASGTYNGGQKTQIMVIVKDSQVAFYINGVPVAYQEIPILSDYKKSERQFGCSGTCYFDNVKFWNLDNIPNLP